jgi:pimeloyl-ACP methyl ester carboxylesterase
MNAPITRRGALQAAAIAASLPALAACSTTGTTRSGPTHFVLVHGAWHGAWCWSKLVPLLRAQGHLVTAVDLPGRWARPETTMSLTPADFVETVGQVVRTSPLPVTLVGHSLGGATISLAAEQYADRIANLVYVAAFLVPSGQSVGTIAMADKGTLIPKAVRRDAATRTSTVIPERAKELFYKDCADDDVRAALQLLCPEPSTMSAARLSLTDAKFGRIKRYYVECLNDRAISLETQRTMQTALPCRKVFTIDSSHSPFMSRPEELASILARIA